MAGQPPIPETTTTPSLMPGLQFPGVNIVLVIAGVVIALLAILLVVLSRRLTAHPVTRNLANWITSPSVSALGLLLDITTNTAKIVPLRRIGPIYVGLEEPVYVIPISEGEVYSFAGKPLLIAVRYGLHGLQWMPATEQIASLSIHGMEESNIEEIEKKLIDLVVQEQSKISREVFIGPGLKLYITVNPHQALTTIKRLVAALSSYSIEALRAQVHAITEEGVKILEAHRRLMETRTRSIVIVVVMIALTTAIAIAILRMFNVI